MNEEVKCGINVQWNISLKKEGNSDMCYNTDEA
jgi:hypothetical protein